MFISPVSGYTRQPRVAATPFFAGKTLVSLDFDGTITSDSKHVRTAIEDASSDHVILINTQRGLHGMGQLSKVLGRNVHYIAGGDGSQLYSNANTRHTVAAFLDNRDHFQQPKDWLDAQVRATNWDHKQVLEIMDSVLGKEASKLLNPHNAKAGKTNRSPIQLKRPQPQEPVFELKTEQPHKADLLAMGKELNARLSKALADEQIKASVTLQSNSLKALKYGITPEGYNKLSPIEYIIKNHPDGIDKVICAGNNMNDVPMLQPKILSGKDNVSLVCGSQPALKQTLGESSHVQYLKDKGLHLGTKLRALIANPSNIRFKVEQSGAPYRHVISGHEFFHHYDDLNNAQKLKYWENVHKVIRNEDSTVGIDSRGTTFIQTKRPEKDWRLPNMTPEKNPLIQIARDKNKWIEDYCNDRFVVVKDLKHSFDKPHFLILPRPLSVGHRGNYLNLDHFLSKAPDSQKVELLDTMAQLVKSAPHDLPDIHSLFRINSGRYQEIPYLHIHYQPYQRNWEKTSR
jgi:hydroxymethylpyrimidine pyrophosphatase-like HAD family hydrolase